MADNNPYSDLFSFEDKKENSAPKAVSTTPASQKDKDVEAAAILKKEFNDASARLANLRSKTLPTKPEDVAALQEAVRREEADVASLQRELKLKGVDAPSPASGGADTSANPYSNLFDGVDDTPVSAGNEIDPFLATFGAAGALAGGVHGARKKPSADSLAAMQLERAYGLPAGSLALMESTQNPGAALSSGEAARLTAERFNPPVVPLVEAAPVIPEAPLSAMEKWTHSQTGEGSRLPSSVISQFTSNVAADPTGAPQGILREAANTRKARAIAPTTEVTPGGLHVVESPKDRQARIVAGIENQRQAALDAALNQPVVPRSETADRRQQNAINQQHLVQASRQSQGMQRGANIAQGGIFGLGTGLQAYNTASDMQQDKKPDWTQWLSLLGNLGGMVGPATTRVPAVGRIPVVGPLATLAQIPYAVKHREAIARGMTMGDVMPPGITSGSEASQIAFPDLQ